MHPETETETETETNVTEVPSRDLDGSSSGTFIDDVKEGIVHISTVVLFAIYIVFSAIFFCNELAFDSTKVLLITNTVAFLRHFSFFIIGVLIIYILRVNKLNRTNEPLKVRSTIVLYFMITPFAMLYWLNKTVQSLFNIFLIKCQGYMFAVLESCEAFAIVLILVMLNDIDRIIFTKMKKHQQLLNRLVVILIITACIGMYIFQTGLNLQAVFKDNILHFYNLNRTINKSCYINPDLYDIVINPIVNYKKYTTMAATSFSISTLFYLFSCFYSIFTPNNEIQESKPLNSHRSDRRRFFFPIIVVIIIMTLTALPLPFFVVNKQPSLKLKSEFLKISKFLLIACYTLTIGLTVFMLKEVRLWKPIKTYFPSMMMNQLFIWGGFCGHMFLFIGRCVENRYIPLFITSVDSEEVSRLWHLNACYNVWAVISVLFQTFLIDLMLKREYQAHDEYSVIHTIQPLPLLVGINLSCLINEFYITAWPPTNTTMSAGIFTGTMVTIGQDFRFLQRFHGLFYFMCFLDKL